MDFGILIIDSAVNIVGRGLVLVIDLKRNKLINKDWVSCIPMKKNDTLIYNNCLHEIVSVEAFANLLNYDKSCIIGLVVKEKL